MAIEIRSGVMRAHEMAAIYIADECEGTRRGGGIGSSSCGDRIDVTNTPICESFPHMRTRYFSA